MPANPASSGARKVDQQQIDYTGYSTSYDESRFEGLGNRYLEAVRCAAFSKVMGACDRGDVVLDVGCGTGRGLTYLHAEGFRRVVGVDFTPEMLTRAHAKSAVTSPRAATPLHGTTIFAHGDALALPVQSSSADLCTNAFGIRNVADRRAGIREMSRVLRPGGRVVILEFTMPPGRVLGALYRFYFTRVLPLVGRIVSRDGEAYAYLPRTVLAWPSPTELQRELEGEGLVECGHQLLTRGIACLHWGRVPA